MLYALVDDLKKGFSQGLPGQQAQYKMVPPGRERTKLENISYTNPKKAAVLVLVYPKKNVPHIVLMRRNKYPGVHSDQISFPGGKLEEFDSSLEQAAIRESNEELGILSNQVEIIGELTQVYIPPSNFMVYPFLGIAKQQLQFIKQDSEVEDIIEVTLADFLNENNVINTKVATSYNVKVEVPAFKLNGHIVWGATAMMLSEIKVLLKEVL